MSYGNPNSPSSSQYTPGPYLNPQPPQQSNTVLWWVLGVLGVLGIGSIVVCCGGGYAMYHYGTQFLADTIKPQIENDPAIEEHIGEITAMPLNFSETQKHQNDNIIVFDVQGTKVQRSSKLIATIKTMLNRLFWSYLTANESQSRHRLELGTTLW